MQATDYSPFGVTLDGKNLTLAGAEKSRYGFNGMEKDDELKGSGNSYDFGTRMLDPRLGRWLTLDPISGKQPSQSPYKAFFNNPIFWVDPDGKTEYETIVIKNEATGKSITFYVSKSNKVKTNGDVYYDEMNGMPYQEYYDYSHVTTITIKRDGSIGIEKTEELRERNGAKYVDWVPIDHVFGTTAKEGSIYDPEDDFIQAGGFYMTGEKGEGTKYYSKNADYVGNVDDLISALGGMTEKGMTTARRKLKGGADPKGPDWGTILEALKRTANGVDVKELTQKVKKEFGISDSDSSPQSSDKGNEEVGIPTSKDTIIMSEKNGKYVIGGHNNGKSGGSTSFHKGTLNKSEVKKRYPTVKI